MWDWIEAIIAFLCVICFVLAGTFLIMWGNRC
jgi:hypothetical protein